ncbi:MAG: cellulase family glycosylhydrolase [Bacteroidia bacterium]|nr:cellulase family glycosylhydrolase [Bacteroidia bacterium]
MVGQNKNILRAILIASYIMIITLIVAGVSILFSYLNTGADRSTMLHTEIQKIDQYLPKVNWAELNNEGRPMDPENLKSIENDYLDAWFVKQVAYKTNTTDGIEDYYTDNARDNIHRLIKLNSAESVTLESTTLSHNPTLDFFSEDGQLAVISDNDVIEFKRVFKQGQLVLETTEHSNYKVILLLEDGFWRIRHLVREKGSKPEVLPSAISEDSLNINGINYYPQATPWNMFSDQFSEETIYKDFKIIKDAGLNSVRIFVQYADFGKAKVAEEKLEKLKLTLDIAEANDIKVVVTLFDFFGDYSVLNWTLDQRHAETIVSSLKDHNALLAWDIKNEPNLDFESRGKELVVSWLDNMIDLVKSIDQDHPITIGWSDTQNASILKDKVDFISFHYYEDLEQLDTSIKSLRKVIPNKPLVMGEYGLSSFKGLWNPFGNTEDDQAFYHKKAQEIIAANNLQFMSWTLYDFKEIPKEVVGGLPWRRNAQKHFGFIDKSGDLKASFKYISRQ